MRKLVIICFVVYMCGLSTSFFFQINNDVYTRKQTEKIDSIYNKIRSRSSYELFKDIASHNLLIISINIVGALSIGGLTLLNTFYNGFIFGYILKIAVILNDKDIILDNILPHSLEIVAIILSSIIGVFYGQKIFYQIIGKSFTLIKNQAVVNFCLIPVCFFLTILSAFMEAYVSMGK